MRRLTTTHMLLLAAQRYIAKHLPCALFVSSLCLRLLPPPHLWICSHPILPRVWSSANHGAMPFRLPIFPVTSDSITFTMRVMLLQIFHHPLDHIMLLICLPTISASDTQFSIRLLQIQTPDSINSPIPELRLHRGYQCIRCSFVLRSQGKEAEICMGKLLASVR